MVVLMKYRLTLYLLFAVAVLLWLPATSLAVSSNDAELARKLAELSRPSAPITMNSGWLQRVAGNEPLHVILVEKDLQLLQVLEYDRSFKIIDRFFCATGQNIGKKLESGDSRTPEGIYFITKEYTDSKVTIFGQRAFHLDYPNYFDRGEGLDGNGIYIHGTNKKLEPNSTNGCITLNNKDLEKLAGYLKQDETPVVVVQNRRSLMAVDSELISVRPEVANMLVLPEDVDPAAVAVDTMYLLNDGIQTVAFGKFQVRSGASSSQGFGRSYLTYGGAAGWQARDRVWLMRKGYGSSSGTKLAKISAGDQKSPSPIATAGSSSPASYPADQQQIADFVENWRVAWQSKDIDRYIDFYDSGFVNDGKDLAAWRRHKETLNKKYAKIVVDISEVSIDWQDEGAKVLFRQIYQSDSYRAVGKKVLYLRYSDDRWRIYREIWLN